MTKIEKFGLCLLIVGVGEFFYNGLALGGMVLATIGFSLFLYGGDNDKS